MDIFLNTIWLIPVYPLIAFVAIVLGLNRSQKGSAGLTVAMIALATVHSWIIVFGTIGAYMAAPAHGETAAQESHAEAAPAGESHGEAAPAEGAGPMHIAGWNLNVPWLLTGFSTFNTGFAVDGFTAAMLFMVPFVCMLIFIYATEYMEYYEAEYGRYARFFAYVSLFAAGMLMLVIANNLLLLFIAWEVMGLCSYLLIGFWFQKQYPPEVTDLPLAHPRGLIEVLQFWKWPEPVYIHPRLASLKAFMTTRVGDVLLFSGMMLLWSTAGTLTFRELFAPEMLTRLAEATVWGMPVATLAALLIFGGAVGKSAQFPLHVWLVDAMEGPTPVSALIHAATMVSAGVYLIARMLPVFSTVDPTALQWVAVIGAITAVMGAVLGAGHYDVKRVLAYSTISQLGYMMMALGLGSFFGGAFHMFTHAFFKALLFLGSGIIIIAMEAMVFAQHAAHGSGHDAHGAGHGDPHDSHAAHHDEHEAHGDHHAHPNPQDMRNMGGLYPKMKVTFWAYLMGTLALVGTFPWAGFWSKDEILAEAYYHAFDPAHPSALAFWVYLAGTVAALFTAFYMGRQIGLVFFGKPRSELAENAVEPGWRMVGPVVVLAVFAVFIGLINIPEDFTLFAGPAWFHHFIGEVHEIAVPAAPGLVLKAPPFSGFVAVSSTLLGLASFFFGWWLYATQVKSATDLDPIERIPVIGKPLFAFLYNRLYIDGIYRALLIYPAVSLATFCAKFDYDWVINPIVNFFGRITSLLADGSAAFDQYGVDGYFVNGIPGAFNWVGGQLRLLQTGRAQNYLLILVIGVLILVALYLLVATGQVTGVAALPLS